MKQPFGIRVLTWFVVLASAGMFVSILLAIRDVGPHIMGGERVTRLEWLHIAAPLVAVIGCLMASIAYAFAGGKPLLASSCGGDLHFDHCVRIRSRCTGRASAHHHVARDC